MSDLINQDLTESLDIAVIGMAGRFPLAKNLEQFWQNLCGGVESIRSFTDDELKAMGVSAAALAHPNFVKAGSILEGVDLFDAAFFNYSPKEAEVLDPQQRIFLECAWEALERAGHDPEIYQNLIGVYAGTSLSSYLLFNLMNAPGLSAPEDTFQMMLGNDKDFLATRVSYELNLTGPSIDVQTGCSTSLVAVHLACQGLLSYHCDMALAGGVSVHVPQRAGYFYQEGGVNSPDGHCRAFDARAKGTVFGSGAGVVVLKRLSDALADGDIIHAVIKGSAINNDGSAKIGYTAPSIEGQSLVIAMAQAVAGIQPETITYIETHGTGTELGDPIEVAALTKAFGATDKRRFCAIGSVKTNIGHLDAAAGVAGFIKTVLALKHKKLPPSLHFQEPNPKIDFENGPFYVNAELSDWSDGDSLRRAGVSSFGIGGTNAHVIVEEPPPSQASGPSREWQLLLLSAKTGAALDQATANLVEFLKEHPATNIADAAYTLQCGRRGFNYRRAAICSDVDDAIEVLESRDPLRVFTSYHEPEDRHVIFMFPGGGAQYVGMGLDLYESEPVFAQAVDSCCETLKPHIGLDLKDILYPRPEREAQAAEMLKATAYALPALFTIEYSMAQLLISWGIAPHASIGHSLGEYVAACLAGVFTLEDALSLVVLRGQLFKHLPTGAMLAVALSEEELLPLLNGKLSLAAINAATQCVVSGSLEAINEMADLLESNEVEFKRLHIAAAGHSEMVTPILGEFAAFVRKLEMEAPAIQFVSNVTGAWITAAEATDPSYWARHLRQTVLFSKGLQELLKEPGRILLEVGPGQSLTTLAKMQTDEARGHAVIPTMRHPLDQQPGQALLLAALGKLWMAGAQIDWPSFYRGESRRRVELPAYAFERTRYWINPEAEDRPRRGQLDSKKPDISEWFYIQSWKRTIAPLAPKPEVLAGRQRTLLVFKDDLGLGEALIGKLEEGDRDVITVISGVKFDRIADRVFSVNPASAGDYRSLLSKLACIEKLPDQILHLWSLTPDAEAQPDKESFKECQERCFYSLVFLGQALAHQAIATPISIWVVTNGLYDVETGRVPRPEKATLLGPCKVIPQEMENITCRCVDIRAGDIHAGKLAEHLLAEIDAGSSEAMLAYRGNNRWSQHYEPVCLDADRAPASRIREDGVYLITGGLGGVGLLLARHLAGSAKARLALVGRSAFPPREDWDQWLAVHDEENELSRRIRKLMELEELGAQVMVFSADVASQTQMRDVVEQVTARFGALHGVIHAAGLAGEKALKLLPEVDRAECEKHFQAKVYGSYVLEKILAGKSLDFCLLISSNASILGGLGMTCYTSASTFLDAFAARRDQPAGTHWMSTTWDGWLLDDEATSASYKTSMDRYAMLPGESIEAFKRALSVDTENQIAISTGDLPARIDLWIKRKGAGLLSEPSQSDARPLHPRPELGTAYVAWSNDTERVIVEIWQELLGVERVGIHDNFFDLGGNSLVGLKVISGLKRELNVEIPVTALFEGPTVKSLAALISRDGHNQQSYTESRGRGERRREKRLKKSNRV
jgi:phthiocerol/phenolphthiocerol synthesis type-I polyketide synthase E